MRLFGELKLHETLDNVLYVKLRNFYTNFLSQVFILSVS